MTKQLPIVLTLMLCLTHIVSAQIFNGCDGQRYVSDIFAATDTTFDVTYGSGITANGVERELMMDIYQPIGDQLEDRPLVILAFGGSFISGARQDIDWLCEAYARKGYVAATVDYRIYDGPLFPIPDSTVFQAAVINAFSDIKASIRYMRSTVDDGNPYRIDPDHIIIGGISAGAIACAHVAVLDSLDNIPSNLQDIIADAGGFEGNSGDNLEYSSEVTAYINYSGGLNQAEWIDSDDPPFYSTHDEFDPTVPYGEGFASVFGIPIVSIDGSARMQIVADSVGVTNGLHTIEGSILHVGYLFADDDRSANVRRTAEYLHDELFCQDFAVATDEPSIHPAMVYPNPTAGQIQLETVADQIVIHDAQGKIALTAPYAPTVDLSGLPNGIYQVRLLTNGQPTASAKVMVQR